MDEAVPLHIFHEPAKTIRVGLAVVQLHWCPHLSEAGLLQQLFAVERGVPLRHIQYGEIERAVSRAVEGWRNPFLILQHSLFESVAGSAVGDNVGLVDDAGRIHSERFENTLLHKISVELPGHFADHYTEHEIAQIAVAPLLAGLGSQWNR